MGYSPWGCKESDTTEQLTHTHTHTHIKEKMLHTVSAILLCYNKYIHMSIKKESQPKCRELCFIQWEFLGLQAQEIAS